MPLLALAPQASVSTIPPHPRGNLWTKTQIISERVLVARQAVAYP